MPDGDQQRIVEDFGKEEAPVRLLIASDVAKDIQKDNGVCLVLSDRKKHCETLQSLLRYKHHVAADLLTGDLSDEERKKVLQRIQTGQASVIVATGQLVGEGFDCPNLSTLFFATPIRFSGRVLQYLGRILRPADENKRARVYDYVDVNVGVLVCGSRIINRHSRGIGSR